MVSYAEVALAFFLFLMENYPYGFRDLVPSEKCNSEEYDFIIVGGGTAGCVLANRLSEIGTWKILLLEAGGQENHYTKTPAVSLSLEGTTYDWNYTTVSQENAGQAYDGICSFQRGRVLGGCSSVGSSIHSIGFKSDYDIWNQDNMGWSFEDIQPYFTKSEAYKIPSLPSRGTDGPITVENPQYETPLRDQIIKAGLSIGLQYADGSYYEGDSIQVVETETNNGQRWSSSAAYLEPVIRQRGNLDVITNALATSLYMDDNLVKGVEYICSGQTKKVHCKREVLLSAGVVNSPKLLMLSGIGPKKHLESLDIKVVADLPVGDHLIDRCMVLLFFKVPSGTITNLEDLVNVNVQKEYLKYRTGPLSRGGVEVTGNVRLSHSSKAADIRFQILTVASRSPDVASIMISPTRPKSTGTIRLKSSWYKDDPIIDPQYLSHQYDRNITVQGLEFAYDLFHTEHCPAVLDTSLHPLCNESPDLLEYFRSITKYYSVPYNHGVGTVKMGLKKNGGVVNRNLQVYDVVNLRVIDASIFPYIPSGNINAVVTMVAEKAADTIKADHGEIR